MPAASASSIASSFDAHMANFWANLLFRYHLPADSSPSTADNFSANSSFSHHQHLGHLPIKNSLEPNPINLAIAVVELLLDCLAPFPNLYFLYLLYARHDLHVNLRVLLGSFSVCLILIALTRIPTQVSYVCSGVLYIDAFRWLVFGHEIAVMFFRTVIVPLTIERVLATVLSKHYEQKDSPMVGICAVLLTFLLSTIIGLYIGNELNNSQINGGVISFPGDFYGLFHIIDVSVRLIIWIIFVALLLYNQRCYAFARLPNKHTLMQRYQFAENVRSSRQLLAIGIIVFLCNLLFDFVMLRIAYNKDHFDVEYSQAFDFVLAVALNIIPMAAIRFHSSMFGVFKLHISRLWRAFLAKCCCFCPAPANPSQFANPTVVFVFDNAFIGEDARHHRQRQKSPRALLTGQKLIFHRAEEQQVYFDELHKSWTNSHQQRRRNTADASTMPELFYQQHTRNRRELAVPIAIL